jgi:Protein of unknown function (DUF2934)
MPRTKPTDGEGEQPKTGRVAANRTGGGGNGGAPSGANGEMRTGTKDDASDDDIARRAYEIYEARGAQNGYDLDHWLEAERQLKPGPTSVTGSISPAKPKKGKKPQAGA